MRFQVAIFDSPGVGLVADHSDAAQGLQWSTDLQGDRALSYTVPLSLRQATALLDRRSIAHVQVSRGAEILWAGRLSDVGIALTPEGTVATINALGYREALTDGRYTALWSDTRTGNAWVPVRTEDNSTYNPSLYEMDANNRVFIALRNGETYPTSGARRGQLAYTAPDRGARDLIHFSASYVVTLPTGFTARVVSWAAGFAGGVSEWTLAGNGTTQTGTLAITLPGVNRAIVGGDVIATTDTTYTGATGAAYFRLTNIRVSSAATPITSATIARDAISGISSVSPGRIDTGAADWTDAVFEDTTPADVLQALAERGDDTRAWEWGVDRFRRVYLRPPGASDQTWQLDVSALELERSTANLINAAYGVYRESSGRTRRTATATDAPSISATGITRTRVISADTTSLARAEALRAVALADGANPRPRASLTPAAVLRAGIEVPGYRVRGGDACEITSLPIVGSAALERVRSFRVRETTYRADSGRVEIVPETPLPRLEYLIR